MTAITIAPKALESQAQRINDIFLKLETLSHLYDAAHRSAMEMLDVVEREQHNIAERIFGICSAGEQLVDCYSTHLAEIRDELTALSKGQAA